MSHSCGRYAKPLTRREMLERCANGFGALALSSLFGEALAASTPLGTSQDKTDLVRRGLHHAPRARNVIFLYMDGAPSQVDTFDYKPMLEKHHGKDPKDVIGKVEKTQFDNNGKVMRPLWPFRRRGESGLWVSDLFPHIGGCIDDLCVVRSLTSNFSEHTSANYFLHTGTPMQGRPSMGAWVSYGLGSDNQNLPGFIVLNGGLIPVGGLDNFNSGFLPASYQGSVFRPADPPVANLKRLEKTEELQQRKADFVKALDAKVRAGYDEQFESAVRNYELSENMEAVAPETMDVSKESEETRKMYGLDAAYPQTAIYARQCLSARRMIERGVRFVELTCPQIAGADRWDQHQGMKKGHEDNARAVDQPIAALLKDLKQRGLLDQTLVLWAGEFGRTPFAQGSDGRDHNPYGFTVWMAGGGVKAGFAHGETDEWGYKVVNGKLEMHDLHATILHLLGVDHKKLTVRFGGRDMRLTDVHGEVVKEILGVNFKPELCCLFGKPVAENPTQAMIEAAFRHHGLDWRYVQFEIEPEGLADAVRGFRAMGFRGGNVTTPHKVAIVKHLDRIAESASLMGAVNCIVRRGREHVGENTDGKGFVQSLREKTDPKGKSVVLLGAGGAARAIGVELTLAGCGAITVVNRDPNRGAELVKLLRDARFVPWKGDYRVPETTDVVVNATSIGLFPDVAARIPLDVATLAPRMVVADVIPNPPETRLVRDARARGCTVLDGLGMLVNQGVIGFKAWTGIDAEPSVMRRALLDVFAK